MDRRRIRLVVLRNELDGDEILWLKACEENNQQIEYRVANLCDSNWLQQIQSQPFDYLLSKPGAFTSSFKQLYDERIYILGHVLNYQVFPSPIEIFIYENKRFLSYWLQANKIQHPATDVYYTREEALSSISNRTFPVVAKTNIGASGRGVVVVKSAKEAERYINNIFSGKGAVRSVGPNMQKGGLIMRGIKLLLNPQKLIKKLSFYRSLSNDVQKDFVIFQEFIPHEYEWRVVRIGESFFAHKKLKLGEKASGSLLKNYDNPPLSLFSFVKEITDKHQLFSQAVDIFQVGDDYFVNEMQCIFGQSDAFQMMVDGVIGRYIFREGEWVFEEGDFNKIECYDLRIKHLIKIFQE